MARLVRTAELSGALARRWFYRHRFPCHFQPDGAQALVERPCRPFPRKGGGLATAERVSTVSRDVAPTPLGRHERFIKVPQSQGRC